MTLIAAGVLYDSTNSQARAIVVSSDQMLSGPGASQHSVYSKVAPLGKTWLIGYAGSPGHYTPVRKLVEERFKPDMTSEQVAALLVDCYQEYRQEQIEQNILKPLGYSAEFFREAGRESLGDETFQSILTETRSYDIDIDFLLAGWSPTTPWDIKLLVVTHPGGSYNYTPMSVAAIGSGAPIALGHLYSFFETLGDLPTAQYRLLEAKFMAEAERSVGPDTLLGTIQHEGISWITTKGCEPLRKVWETHQKAVPQVATKFLSEITAIRLDNRDSTKDQVGKVS